MKTLVKLFVALILCSSFLSPAIALADKKILNDGRTIYSGPISSKLENTNYIEGNVFDAVTKLPVKSALIELKNANFGVGYYQVRTDYNGYFRIDNFISHLQYRLEVTAEGFVNYRQKHVLSGDYKRLSIPLDSEAIISGKVHDSAAKPLAGVEVVLQPSYRHYYASGEDDDEDRRGRAKPIITTTDEHGFYRFNKLWQTPGILTFRKPGYIKETAHFQTLKKGNAFELPMLLYRTASLAGRILIHGLKIPAANVDVLLSGSYERKYSGVTYEDGGFGIEDIKPGRYHVGINHPGFYETDSKREVVIKEGDAVRDYNFTISSKEPQLEVYADRYTFVPGQPVNFSVKTFRLEKYKARLFSVPTAAIIKDRINLDNLDPEKSGFKSVREWDESVRDFKPYDWRYQTLEIAGALPTGAYLIEIASADGLVSRKFFSLTTMGIVVKRSQNKLLVYATDLIKNAPLENVTVNLYDLSKDKVPAKEQPAQEERTAADNEADNLNQADDENSEMSDDEGADTRRRRKTGSPLHQLNINSLTDKSLAAGKTNSDGLYQSKVSAKKTYTVFAVDANGSYAFCLSSSSEALNQEKNKFLIYTDRPVYRAGDQVFYKIVAKKRGQKFSPIQKETIYYEIKNNDFEKIIAAGELKLDEWGTASGSIKLEEDGKLGEYSIKVGFAAKELFANGKFYVEQYRKPEFKIDLTPTKEYFINRDTVEFKVEAKYLFGAPLKDAMLQYRFYETKLRDTDTRYWWEEDLHKPAISHGRLKLEGNKQLDANGIAVLRLAGGDLPYDREITLEATVVDNSNVSITSRTTVKVGRGEYYIKINPAKNFYSDEENKIVEIKTLSHNGVPKSVPVDVKLYRYVWRPSQMIYLHDTKPAYAATVTTDSQGSYKLELPRKLNGYGEFDVVVQSKDSKDNIITASRVIWVYSWGGANVESRFKNLELSVSNNNLDKPGEVTCLIKSRFADSYVLLTLEGRDIFEQKVVKMNGNILPVKLDIKAQYAPNLFVSAAMQRGRALFTGTAGINLPNTDVSLNINMKPNKEKYLPGEKASLDITVLDDNGKPRKTDLSLSVVDEAIYLIRPDHTPKMRDFFYARTSNWVMTNYSYTFTILAGAAKESKTKIREKFADTAFWQANIITDEQGKAKLSFALPDNLTTWRLTARGHDRNGRVGERKDEILVTQDLIARIGKPRFAVEGDKLNLIGIVNSNTNRGLPAVKTEFTVDDKLLPPDERTPISLPAFGSARNYYPLTIPEGRERLSLLFKAEADGQARDGLKINLPVHSRGTAYKLYGTGDFGAHKSINIKPLKDTADFEFIPEEIIISVNPSPIFQLLKASRFLAEYPYGCVEQTLSKFMPLLALKSVLAQKGLNQFVGADNIDDKIAMGISRIQKYQNEDGSWGWWYADAGNAFLTGYVLYSLHTTRKLGYRISEETAAKGVAASSRQLNGLRNTYTNSDQDARAYLLFVLALWGKTPVDQLTDLMNAKQLSPYSTAYLLRAMVATNKMKGIDNKVLADIDRKIPEMITHLKAMQKRDALGIYWDAGNIQPWEWQGGRTEISAHVLAALVEAGEKSSLLPQIVSSIARRNKGDAWVSTKETAAVMLSLCAYLEQVKTDKSLKGNITFTLDGKPVANFQYDSATMKDVGELTKKIKLGKKFKVANFALKAQGAANPDAVFDATLNGNIYFNDKGFFSFLKSEDRGLKSLENGISISRSFFSITRVKDINNNEYYVPQAISDKKVKMRVGDEILVKIKFAAQDNFKYLVLEDYLPSGFEVVTKNIYHDYMPYSHLEQWDNRMVFFFTGINSGTVYELAYIIRAELPGEYLAKPARMECMYEPSIQGWSLPAKFKVDKK